MQTVII